jgi:hypothetical protein
MLCRAPSRREKYQENVITLLQRALTSSPVMEATLTALKTVFLVDTGGAAWANPITSIVSEGSIGF